MRRSELGPGWITAVGTAFAAIVAALTFLFGSGVWTGSTIEHEEQERGRKTSDLGERASRLPHTFDDTAAFPRIVVLREKELIDLSPIPLQFLCTFDERLGELIGTLWITPGAEQAISRLLHDPAPTTVAVDGFEYLVQVLDTDYAGRSARISVSRKRSDPGEAK